jgi:hypothetical protein
MIRVATGGLGVLCAPCMPTPELFLALALGGLLLLSWGLRGR